ncbi:hypothetical protein PIB30_023700 [Stylosanthes scabra]|uniref:Uncharacterized protein n=1 Tax=Stylosanthes scabra TaxID=79078 RepID=A0ABU6U8I5_9FABA|nr:hypothetical protein [Stylosanthes scabra]
MRRPRNRRRRLGACQRPTHVGEGRADPIEVAESVEATGRGWRGAYPTDLGWCQHQAGGRGGGDKFTGLPPIHPSDPGDHDPIEPDTQFNGSQVHLDLIEPLSGPSHLFMALGGTPPSAAHVPSGSWDVPFMEHACLPTPPASPALAEQPDEPAARGRARRAPRRRGCGTGGHM